MAEYITEEAMLDDLQQILAGMVRRLSYIFSGPQSTSLAEQPPSNGPWIFNLNVSRFEETCCEEPETIDISNLSITRTMKDIRRYGVDGICPSGEHVDDLIMNGQDFIESVRSANDVDINNDIGAGTGACTEVFDRALARWELDHGASLSIPQVARLAGLDERTVRNAASTTGKGKLQTFSQDARTLVRSETAYAWLTSKRGFVPTTFVDEDFDADPTSFSNATDFMKFLSWKRETLGLDVEDAVKAAGHHLLHKEAWSQMENEGKEPSLRFIPGIASALHVEEVWLTEKVMKIFYSRQLEILTSSEVEK